MSNRVHPIHLVAAPAEVIRHKYKRMSIAWQIQIQTAANGMVSGTLRQWPMLLQALRYLGYSVTGGTTADNAKNMCREIVGCIDTEGKQ